MNNKLANTGAASYITSYTYDAIGNPLTYNGWTYGWEAGRQLKTLTGNGNTISYKYDDSGIRTQKVVNGVTTNYHLVGDKVTYEDNGTDKIYYTYDSSDNLVSMNLNGVEYYYIRNAQGDITGLFDGSGTQVVTYTYDSWGKIISTTGTLASTVGAKNPYRYRGYRYDSETGLYYLQSRYYNPEWGRFLNMDAIAGTVGELLSHNVFAYCENNPINGRDPSGFRVKFDTEEEAEYYQWLRTKEPIKNTSESSTVITTATQQNSGNDSLMYAKGGKSQPNSKFRGTTDEEINNGANDKSLSGAERREYQQEQKFRGLRDVNKRKELYGGGNKSGRKNDSTTEAVSSGIKWGMVIYLVISEGSRLFPPRNLVPIP